MDEIPVRRSLRVAGMTPLRPMSSIMFSEQTRGKSPIRGRSRSRTGTPRRGANASTTMAPPDSRLKQALNLPSDISSSDFLGETPTARFHRAAAKGVEDTVVARRTITTKTNDQQTLRARKVARRPSSVFLRSNERDSGGMGLMILSVIRVLSWSGNLLKKGTIALVCLPVYLMKTPWRSKLPFWIIGFVCFIIVSYAISQLDWQIAQKIGSSIVNRSISKTRLNSVRIPIGKDIEGSIKALRDRMIEIESSVNEIRAHILGFDELIRRDFQSIESRITLISERETLLDSKISSLESDLREAINGLLAVQVTSTRLDSLSEQYRILQETMKKVKHDFDDAKGLHSIEVLQNLIRSQLAEILPQQLLVRRKIDGSIYLDTGLLRLLHDMFMSRGDEMNATQGEMIVNSPSNSINFQAIENLLNGKLSQFEHKVVSKEEVAEIISKKLLDELTNLKKYTIIEQAAIDGKLSSFEARIPKQEKLRGDIADMIKKSLDKQLSNPIPDGIGVADYALESMGTRVVPSKTSPIFTHRDGLILSLLNPYGCGKPAKTALNADNSLGNCWAFSGPTGNLTVILGTPIIPTHFSVDHVSYTLQVDRSSAPRQFKIYGMSNRKDAGILLGEYEYSLAGPPTQTVPAQFILSAPIRLIKLVILSNYGRREYTCLYRFRVHSLGSHLKNGIMYSDSQ